MMSAAKQGQYCIEKFVCCNFSSFCLKLQSIAESNTEKTLCVMLKCIGGPHIGQRFRLEPTDVSAHVYVGISICGRKYLYTPISYLMSFTLQDGEDVFKMGRSTGKQFKEKGVSLYKDKEISTTHAKVRNKLCSLNQSFFLSF